MACKYKYNNNWYSKEELQSILYKERGIDKYGKLVKPKINTSNKKQTVWNVIDEYGDDETLDETVVHTFNSEQEAKEKAESLNLKGGYDEGEYGLRFFVKKSLKQAGIQPTQTKKTLKESIVSVQTRLDSRGNTLPERFVNKGEYKGYDSDTWYYKINDEWYMKHVPFNEPFDTIVEDYNIVKMSDVGLGIDEVWDSFLQSNPKGIEDIEIKDEKEYTSQALINTKVAALKEVAKKYPRSLIRSEVKPIQQARQPLSYFEDELQKVPSSTFNSRYSNNQENEENKTILPEIHKCNL